MSPTYLAPFRRFTVIHCLALLVFFAGGSTSAILSAAEGTKTSFDLPADVLEKSVKRFAAQSGLEVLIPSDALAEVRTKAVRGEMTSRQALDAMLAGTGLTVLQDPKTGALAVRKETPGPNGQRAAQAVTRSVRPNQAPAVSEEATMLSPFEVVSENDRGYQAANTLGATRTNVSIRDLPMQINVVTEQQLVDRALFDLDQVLDVIPGVAREFDEFVPRANIRGFGSSAAMRNGVRGLLTPDMSSIARVETIKGPAALLYGQTQPGGVINYITKNPSPTRSTNVRLSAGSNSLFRAELDTTGPLNTAKTFNYRLATVYYYLEKGERLSSNDRVQIAPMLQWKPFQATSIVVRYSNTHDNMRENGGSLAKPAGAINRGGDPSQFYPFNGLDPVDVPQWDDKLGPGFKKDAPASWRDTRSSVWELEATQRLNSKMDLRGNFAYHRRHRESIREGGSRFANPWTQTGPTIASLGGFNSWNVDNTRGTPLPESLHTYGFYGRDGVASVGIDPLSDTRLLNGVPYVYNPAVATMAYEPGKNGFRRVEWGGSYRAEERVNFQIDLITRFNFGPFENTVLTGIEHNQERTWNNGSSLTRDRSIPVAGLYTIPGTTTQVPNLVDFWYNPYSAASTAARDAFATRNVPTLDKFQAIGNTAENLFTSNGAYLNWSAAFAKKRGRFSFGGRYDEVSGRNTALNTGVNPVTFDGVVTSSMEGARKRSTPQTGLSFRVADPISLYVLYSQSVNPRISLQPARTAARETALRNRYQQEGLPPPNLDALPWSQLLEPEYGRGFEYGVKTDLFENRFSMNAAYFMIDKKNVVRGKPADDPDSVAGFVDLSGAEQARGIDLDFYARPVRELQIGGGGLYNSTKIVAINPTTIVSPFATTFAGNTGANVPYSLLGRRTPNAPKWSGNGYVRYEFSEGLLKGVGVGISYIYMGVRRENDNLRWSSSWSRWDANASYRMKLLNRSTSFGLAVKNATSRIYRVDRDTFAQPRTYVFSMGINL
jgi:outer membrane receptor protein involved in Fe transport